MMKNIELNSYGKVNLALDVLYKRDDGYHEIDTIMQQISLSDRIIMENTNKKSIEIRSNKKNLPLDSNNLVYKAWESIVKRTGERRGVRVSIQKEIPIAAGLAGGSSNAAASLRGLNEMWNLNLSDDELYSMALEIGADVPYCLMGGTAHAKGIGEELTPLKPFKDKDILLFNPGIEISTAYVYKNLKLSESGRIDMEKIIDYIERDDLLNLSKNMENIMEKTVIKEHPVIGEIKEMMKKLGASGALMSGSGATVFGLFDDAEKLDYCKGKLEKMKGLALKAKTL